VAAADNRLLERHMSLRVDPEATADVLRDDRARLHGTRLKRRGNLIVHAARNEYAKDERGEAGHDAVEDVS
jgi:hypothetical protein